MTIRAAAGAVLTALGAIGAAAPSPAPVRVTVRPTGASCAVRDAAGAPAPDRLSAAAGGFSWQRRDGDVLSCDGPGLEPHDLAPGGGALPPEVTLELRPARAVALETEWGGAEATVEWRAIGWGGTTLLARRRLAVPERATLPVADEARLLRFHAEGRSPVSVFVPGGAPGRALRVPRAAPGGEILGILPSHAIAPQAVDLVAPTARVEIALDPWRVFVVRGLAPGSYAVAPRYRGGVSGRPHGVVVRAGRTSELLPLPFPEPGAVVLFAGPDLCGGDQLPLRLWVRRAGAEGGEGPAGATATETIDDPPCDRELDGLEEGEYEAGLARLGGAGEADEVLSTARFQVARGHQTKVAFVPTVSVGGRVSFGPDRPAVGVTLAFQSDSGAWTARTDEDGDYAVRLGDPGEYTVSVQAAGGLPSVWFTRRLDGGTQREDFALSEAALHVRVTQPDGAPPEEAVELAVTGTDGKRIAGELPPGREEAVRFVGLDFGEYVVTASTPSGLTSQYPAQATLSAEGPVAEVEVVLGRHEGLLEVVDEDGAPVEPSQVRAGAAPLVPVAPGMYRLGGVPVGERLKLRAEGYAPVCRVLRPSDLPNLRLVLARASETLTIHFAPHLPWESGLLEGLPGSDCPVELHDAEAMTQLEPTRTTLVVRVSPGPLRLVLGSATYPLVAPGSEVHVSEPGATAQAAGEEPAPRE